MYLGLNDIDLFLSYDLDINFDNGDLKTMTGSELITRKVIALLSTEKNEWKLYPNIGASPIKYIGQKNTRELGSRIKNYLENNIRIELGLEFSVFVAIVPINYESVKCYIDVYYLNNLVSSVPVTLDFINGLKFSQTDLAVDKLHISDKLIIPEADNVFTANDIQVLLSRQETGD